MDLLQYFRCFFRAGLVIAVKYLNILFTKRAMLIYVICTAAMALVLDGHALNKLELKSLQAWLMRHPQFRLATEEDCRCADDIQRMKSGYGGDWGSDPDYHPYVVTGDFNGDGIRDFAVVVLDQSKATNNFALLVFNGPFRNKPALPAFIKQSLDLKYQGLFYGPPRRKPYRLVLGRFEAEGTLLVPHGRTYKMK